MSVNAQRGLVGYVSLTLAPLRAAAQSELHLRELAGTIGWDLDRITGLPLDDLAERLADFVAGTDELLALVDDAPRTLPELLDALDATQRAFQAIHDLPSIFAAGTGPSQFEEFGRDLIEAAATAYLQLAHPVAYHLAVLLTLIEPPDNAALSAPQFDGAGNLVRFPHTRPRLRLDRLPNLIDDPLATLRSEYVGPDGLATPAGAQQTADRLFPRVAALLAALGMETLYGTKSIYGIDLGDPEHLAGGMLTCWLTPRTSALSAGTTLSLSSSERGDLGLVISPFGQLNLTEPFDRWRLTVEATTGVDALGVGPQGVKLLLRPGSSAPGFVADVSAVRLPPGSERPALVGSTAGTRLELQGVALFGSVVLSEDERELALELEVPSATLVVAPSDGDGFLGAILPPDGLRTDFRLAIRWSSRSGLTFRGSAGLEAQFPVGASFGPLSIESVHLGIRAADGRISVLVATTAGVQLGPVKAVVARTGLEASVSLDDVGNLGVADLAVGFEPPTGVGLAIMAPAVSGGGFLHLDHDAGRYAGVFELTIVDTVSVKAIAIITTKMPDGSDGFALLIVITADGFTPIQLGMGFTLTAIGGLLALNRTVDADAVSGGLSDGVLDSVLFAKDPVGNIDRVLTRLETIFPAANDRLVVGPLADVSWGSPPLVKLRIALLLEVPQPVRAVLLAALTVVLPRQQDAVVELHVDAIGVLDLGRGELSLDASLHHSRLLELTLTGDMALRLNWGSDPTFLLSVGGFHPKFAPPRGLRPLKRLALTLTEGKNPLVRFEAYLALTSNTIQMGARVTLYASKGGFGIEGGGSFDALIQWSPFAIEVGFAAWARVFTPAGTLLAVSVAVNVTGPSPWHVTGKATVHVLFFSFTVGIDLYLGAAAEPQPVETVDVAARLWEQVSDRANWEAVLPPSQTPGVTLAAADASSADASVVAHPLSVISMRQRVIPLGRAISRVGAAVPTQGTRTYELDVTVPVGGLTTAVVDDLFAPAQYTQMSDDARLAQPSFTRMPAGVSVRATTASSAGPGLACDLAVETLDVTDLDDPAAKGTPVAAVSG